MKALFAASLTVAGLCLTAEAKAQTPANVVPKLIKPTPLGCASAFNERYTVPYGAAGKLVDKWVWPLGTCKPTMPLTLRPTPAPAVLPKK